MDDIPNNQLLDDLPTQNEIMQSNNNEERISNYNPPPIYDNNIPQEVIQNNNNEQIPINNIPPPIYDNNITPQEYSKPSENIPSQYPPLPEQNPNIINEDLNEKIL